MFSSVPTPQDIFLTRLFEEPLVPIGADPTPSENKALAAALLAYSKRSGPDDFSSLTGFLEIYPTPTLSHRYSQCAKLCYRAESKAQ